MDIVSDTIPQIMANCLFSFWHSSYLIHLNFCIKTKSKNIQVHNWHKTKLFEISWPKYKEIHEHFLNYHLFQIKKKQFFFLLHFDRNLLNQKKSRSHGTTNRLFMQMKFLFVVPWERLFFWFDKSLSKCRRKKGFVFSCAEFEINGNSKSAYELPCILAKKFQIINFKLCTKSSC